MSIWLKNKKTNQLESHSFTLSDFFGVIMVFVGLTFAKKYPDFELLLLCAGTIIGFIVSILGRVWFIKKMKESGDYEPS